MASTSPNNPNLVEPRESTTPTVVNPVVVDELRQMFVDGATPSQLMRRIASEEADEAFHFLVMDYFKEAFGLPLVRNVTPDAQSGPDLRHAHFNRDVLPEMIQRVSEWNTGDLEGSWLQGLTVSSLNKHTERLKATPIDELSRVWGDLNDSEQLFIVRRIAVKEYYWEVLKGLAALAERLQQKNAALEARLPERREESMSEPVS